MKLHNLLTAALMPVFAVALTGCQGDDTSHDITGDPISPDSPQIFFPQAEKYYYEFTADAELNITVEIARLNAKDAIEVPIAVSTTLDGFVIPEKISFEAGQTSAEFVIDCSEIPAKQLCELKVSVPEGMSTPYAAGTETYVAKVLILGSWAPIATDVVYTYDKVYTGESYGELQQMEGTQRYKLTNFLGSGCDLPFVLGYKSGNRYQIVPTSNYMDFEEVFEGYTDYYNSWYFYDSENEDWFSWSPDGVSEPELEYALIYTLDDEDNSLYTYINFIKGEAYVTISADYADGSSGWLYSTLKFTPTQQ